MEGKTAEWINATLHNDETSSDTELIKYFVDNGIDESLAKKIVEQRQAALLDPHYEVKFFESHLDTVAKKIRSVKGRHLGDSLISHSPWRISERGPYQSKNDPIFWNVDVISGGLRVARVSGVGKDMTLANARLISAAPELLKVLTKAYMSLPDETPSDKKVLDMVRQAIAKAEGAVIHSDVYAKQFVWETRVNKKVDEEKLISEIISRLFWYLYVANRTAYALQYEHEPVIFKDNWNSGHSESMYSQGITGKDTQFKL